MCLGVLTGERNKRKTPAGIRAGGGFDFGLLCVLPLRRGHNDYAYYDSAGGDGGGQWCAVEAVEHNMRAVDVYAACIMHESPELPQQCIPQRTRRGSGPR